MKEIDVLNPKERRQRIELLELRTKLYRKAHKAGNLTPKQKKDYLIDLREIERLKRIDRSEKDDRGNSELSPELKRQIDKSALIKNPRDILGGIYV